MDIHDSPKGYTAKIQDINLKCSGIEESIMSNSFIAKGQTSYNTVDIEVTEIESSMCIMTPTMPVYITKEQAMEFFNLVEPGEVILTNTKVTAELLNLRHSNAEMQEEIEKQKKALIKCRTKKVVLLGIVDNIAHSNWTVVEYLTWKKACQAVLQELNM